MNKSLADLAARVSLQAKQLLTRRKSATLLTDLQSRVAQMRDLTDETSTLVKGVTLLLDVDSRLKVPKKRLSPRLKNLRRLEEKVAIDVATIIPPDALDVAGLSDSLKEVKDELQKRWSDFLKPERGTQALESLSEETEVSKSVSELKQLRSELANRQASLPEKKSDITEVLKIKKRIEVLADQLRAHGFEDDVLAFLGKTRDLRGVPLGEVLANPKIRKWLESGSHASSLRVIHDSVLSQRLNSRG